MKSGNFGTKDKVFAIVLCFSESSLDWKAKHQGKYIGVCGVDPHIWKPYLKDLGIHYNSLQGGMEVYKFYLEKNNSEYKALLDYKGVKSNTEVKEIAKKIIYIKNQILKNHKVNSSKN
jgi:hypothetical protein